ncbi:MAG: MXAN_5808 family serine peptidase [Pseudomonadota bacterium]
MALRKSDLFKLITILFLVLVPSAFFSYRYASCSNTENSLNIFKTFYSKSKQLSTYSEIADTVDEKYVDKSKINYKEMFVNGLKEIEKVLPELQIVQQKEKIIIKLNEKIRNFYLKDIKSLKYLKKNMIQAYEFIRNNTSDEFEDEEIEEVAINGMLMKLDPHTNFLPRDVYNELKVGTMGKFGGLGIVITIKDGDLVVISPIDDTPAFNAGIKAGDKIVRIDNASTVNMTLIEAVRRMRGDPGTDVTLWVARDTFKDARPFILTRDIIKIQSVDSKLLPGGVVLIRLKNFHDESLDEIKLHLSKYLKRSDFRGVVFDLRNNPGGVLRQAHKISDLFIESGDIVSIVGSDRRETKKATWFGTLSDFPLVTLVNEGSASASEIVAAALKEHDRSVIIGDKTFGKGTVQQLFEMHDGSESALKITISKFISPSGREIKIAGVMPDIRLYPANIEKNNMFLFKKHHTIKAEYLEKMYGVEGMNMADYNNSDQSALHTITYFKKTNEEEDDDLTKESKGEVVLTSEENDFELFLASEIIRHAKSNDRQQLLAQAQKIIVQASGKEEIKIKQELKKFDIDWGFGLKKEKPKVSINFYLKEGNGKAGEKIHLACEVKNNGKLPLYQVWALTESDSFLFTNHEFIFGKINAGQTLTREIEIELSKATISQIVNTSLVLKDHFERTLNKDSLYINIESLDKPTYSYNYQIIDDSSNNSEGNGDGVPSFGETIDLKLLIKNNSEIDSGKILVSAKATTADGIFLVKGREEIEQIKKGEVKEVTMNFRIDPSYSSNSIQFKLFIYDDVYETIISDKLKLDLARPEIGPGSHPKGFLELKEKGISFYSSPFKASNILYINDEKLELEIMEKRNGFYKVKLNNGAFAWIESSANVGIIDSKKTHKDKLVSNIEWFTEHNPPLIKTLSNKLERSNGYNKYHLKYVIQDNEGLKDVYIYLKDEKISYLKLNGEKEYLLDQDINLESGRNFITIRARDNSNLITSQSIAIYNPEK